MRSLPMFIRRLICPPRYRCSHRLKFAGLGSGRRLRALPSRCRSTAQQAQQWQGRAESYIAEAQKPAFLAVQFVLAVGFLALMDGGFSGMPEARQTIGSLMFRVSP